MCTTLFSQFFIHNIYKTENKAYYLLIVSFLVAKTNKSPKEKEFKVEGDKYRFIETSCYKLNTPKLLQYWQSLNGRSYLKVVPEPLSVPQGWGRWMTWDLQQTTKESKARLCSGWMESSCKNRVGMLWMNLWEAQLQNISIHAELFVLNFEITEHAGFFVQWN